MIRLSKEQVILLHERLIEITGGSNGIRDDGMLESALANPFQSFGDEELYTILNDLFAVEDKTEYIRSLNGYELSYTQKELSDTILDLAAGKIGAEDVLQWIISHQK